VVLAGNRVGTAPSRDHEARLLVVKTAFTPVRMGTPQFVFQIRR